MEMRGLFAAALAAVAGILVASLDCFAESSVMDVSGARIVVPEPPGLVRLVNSESPYYRFVATSQARMGSELLAVYLPAADAASADMGEVPAPRHWALAYAIGPLKGKAVSREVFHDQILPPLEASIAKAMANLDLQKKIDDAANKGVVDLAKDLHLAPGKLRLGEMQPLGIDRNEDTYVTYAAAARVRVEPPSGPAVELPLVMSTGFVLARDRLFSIAVYSQFRDERDVEVVKKDSASWAEAITRAN